jgi:hypothetical protein
VKDQLIYMSHSERQKMSVDSFIFNNHFSDASAFNDYSSGVLKAKIMGVLGDSTRKDLSEGAGQVDWEISETRTSPIDH